MSFDEPLQNFLANDDEGNSFFWMDRLDMAKTQDRFDEVHNLLGLYRTDEFVERHVSGVFQISNAGTIWIQN